MVNSTHCTENSHILNDILRTQWGWVVSWCRTGVRPQAGHGAASMNAGLDLEMPVPSAFTTLSSDLTAGTLSSATLTQAATYVMNARTKMKDFDATYMSSTGEFQHGRRARSPCRSRKRRAEGRGPAEERRHLAAWHASDHGGKRFAQRPRPSRSSARTITCRSHRHPPKTSPGELRLGPGRPR